MDLIYILTVTWISRTFYDMIIVDFTFNDTLITFLFSESGVATPSHTRTTLDVALVSDESVHGIQKPVPSKAPMKVNGFVI